MYSFFILQWKKIADPSLLHVKNIYIYIYIIYIYNFIYRLSGVFAILNKVHNSIEEHISNLIYIYILYIYIYIYI